MTTTNSITFLDRLSRLSFGRAAKLLGPEGQRLIQQGGQYEVALRDVEQLNNQAFVVHIGPTRVEIRPVPGRSKHLCFTCDQCSDHCVHIGAAVSLVLEEKTALGLAKEPDLTPVASLSEEEAVARALAERRDRAEKEPMRIQAAEAGQLWTDYAVTNSLSGKCYRVALRSFADDGSNYCSCPDFRANTLGTCKHLMHVQTKMRKRSTKAQRHTPYQRVGFAVALRYGSERELWLLPPADLDTACKRRLRKIHDKPIDDIHSLLRLVPKLEKLGHAVRIHPDAKEYIQQWLHREHLSRIVAEVRAAPATHPLRTELLAAELLPYQLDGIAFAAAAGRAILADDTGLGKTIQGIGVAEFLARHAEISKVLVICPASLKGQWQAEIARFSGRSCRQVLGGMAERPAQYADESFFIVVNYEQILRDHHAISLQAWDLIILDEGQRIKNWEAKTSQVIKSLRSPFALVLSGTPLENRLDDLYSVAQFIDARHLGPDFRFFNRHQVVNESGRVLGYPHMDEIRARLRPLLLRRTRAELVKQLPPRATEVVRVPATQEQVDITLAQKRIIAHITSKSYISEMDLLRLRRAIGQCRMVADSTYLCEKIAPGHSGKLERLAELLADLAAEPERKMIVFSEWTTMLDLIEPLCVDAGLELVRLNGSVPQKKRQALVDRFQDDPACRVFLCTNAGATGLNLQAADTVINVDLPWNPAVLEQRIARAHRMGQQRPVQVYLLVSQDTIEEQMLGTLANKADMALAVLDETSDVTEVSISSGIEELKRKMEILLGKPDAAPTDDEAQRAVGAQLARKRQVEVAGGKLLRSAFAFLAESLPRPEGQADGPLAHYIAHSLRACTEEGEDSHLRLSVDLGDGAGLEALAQSIAGILSAAKVAS